MKYKGVQTECCTESCITISRLQDMDSRESSGFVL